MTWDVTLRKRLRHDHASFTIDVRFASASRRLVLHGPSGAGKTQTLRMIAGISTPDAGRVAVAGRVVFDSASRLSLAPRERRLGYVFQDYALFPHLTVEQNIAFARHGGWRNPPRRVADAAVERWIAAFHLESVAGHHPHQISGGQRQRTALARALVTEPAALLLDEPFAALDKRLRERLRLELKDLVVDLGLPMLLITHDDEDVGSLAEEVVEMNGGRVEEPVPRARRTGAAREASPSDRRDAEQTFAPPDRAPRGTSDPRIESGHGA